MEPSELATSLFAIAFGLWAGIVGWIGAGIRADIKEMAKAMQAESRKLNQYIVQTETRLAVIEAQTGLRNGRTN